VIYPAVVMSKGNNRVDSYNWKRYWKNWVMKKITFSSSTEYNFYTFFERRLCIFEGRLYRGTSTQVAELASLHCLLLSPIYKEKVRLNQNLLINVEISTFELYKLSQSVCKVAMQWNRPLFAHRSMNFDGNFANKICVTKMRYFQDFRE
jgi:hypothetical protein